MTYIRIYICCSILNKVFRVTKVGIELFQLTFVVTTHTQQIRETDAHTAHTQPRTLVLLYEG